MVETFYAVAEDTY
jgi:hypothetical protein